jgi:hypothetical protein
MAPRNLSLIELNRALLARQQLLTRKRLSVAKTIHNVGGLQTQEPKDATVALWSRIAGFNPKKLRDATAKREIVRGSHLRCTIHTITAEDFVDYRLTMSTLIERDAKNWSDRYVGLDVPKVKKATQLLLSDDLPRTAREIGDELQPQFPSVHREGLSHCARFHVPMVMTPTDDRWGYSRPPKLMLAERLLGKELVAQEAKAQLLLRGIAAIGPASFADLRTWSGLTGVREALEPHLSDLMVFRDESGRELYDLPDAPRPRADTPAPIRFLGEFDNVALSHADRTRIVDPEDAKLYNFSKNGRRAFTILIDGRVRASWQVARKKQEARIILMPFGKEPKRTLDELGAEGEALLRVIEPDSTEYVVEFAETDLG